MTLFTDAPGESEEPGGSAAVSPRERRTRIGWVFLAVAFAIALLLGLAPAPYVIEQPGPVFNTLGSAAANGSGHSGTGAPLITIPHETTYPTAGALDLLTVSAVGNPSSLPSWFEVLSAWLDPQKAVLPVDVAYPPSVTVKQQNAENTAQMVNSQQDAIAAALNHLGYTFPQSVDVKQVIASSPASGKLKAGDQITAVDSVPVHGIQSLRDAIAQHGTATPAAIGIVRDGTPQTVEITPAASGHAAILGIGVGMNYTFPITVKIRLDNVGGPSAGMMFALGIIDKLTPGQLNGGKKVAGTGTIDSEGNVGPIGGIQQKMFGARGAGATIFLAPASNCNEVTGHVPDGLRVFAVKKLDDSLTVLKTIVSGGNTGALTSCPAH